MNRGILILAALFALSCTKKLQPAAGLVDTTQQYNYYVDLNRVDNDKLIVRLSPPAITASEAVFCIPRIVPGIYGVMNFGRNIENLEARDKNNRLLKVEKKDINQWIIYSADQLKTLTYAVNDGWEEFDENMQEGFYRSAESTFKDDVFVINNNCLFGYFKGYESQPIQVYFSKPALLFGATSLPSAIQTDTSVLYYAKNYRYLVDNPILFSKPDTAVIRFSDIEVTVAAYSTSKEMIAKEIASYIRPLIENQRNYLGGRLPVDKYTFMIYHSLGGSRNYMIGDGLEHSFSTLILLYMPLDKDVIKKNVYGIASHEFFHTIMPLGLHAKEIANYDFIKPRMSKHLWLYEGMTEYFAIHMPVKEKAQTIEDFIETLEYKIERMKSFDQTLSLTELSKNAMERQDQYYNFYLKGPLVIACMDIRLREFSDGKYGVQNLISDLLARYGENKPFDDDELFDDIAALSKDPGIKLFIAAYLEGGDAAPLKEYLAKAGFDYTEATGKISLTPHPTPAQLTLRKYWIGQ